jgi:hypothetical protein
LENLIVNEKGYANLQGDCYNCLVSLELRKNISDGIVSTPNDYIKVSETEYDILILTNQAKPISNPNSYFLQDLVGAIEVKVTGVCEDV